MDLQLSTPKTRLRVVSAALLVGVLALIIVLDRDGRLGAAEPVIDPEAAAIQALNAATGNACVEVVDGTFLGGENLDERVNQAGGPGRWLEPGVSWIGSAREAVSAFDAKLVVDGSRSDTLGELWIQLPGETDRFVQLREQATSAAVSVWSIGDEIHSADPARCKAAGEAGR